MHRRVGRTAVLAAALALAGAISAPSPVHATRRAAPAHAAAARLRAGRQTPGTPPPPSLAVDVEADAVGRPAPPGFIGLSVEYSALEPYAGARASDLNPVFVALLRALAPGASPVLRIGGDSTDVTWWPVRGVRPRPGVTYALTRAWLGVARAVARADDARLILGINLADGSPRLAAAEARALLRGVGRRSVAALEIGNEPDLYTMIPWDKTLTPPLFARPASYAMPAFMSEFARWRAAIPRVPLAGPTLATYSWMPSLDAFLAAEPQVRLVTFHRYPTRSCVGNPTAVNYASIPNLLSDQASYELAQQVAPYVAAAHRRGRPFRLDELNSASCAGKPGVSNTFASALWALDTLFDLASVGLDGVNIHTLPGSAYAPFSFVQRRGRWYGSVTPLYYGLLLFARAFPPGARLLRVSAPTGPVKTWATRAPDGRVRIVLINKDPVTSVVVHVALPGSATAPAAVQALRAPALNATSRVSLGGRSFGPSTTSGVLPAPRSLSVRPDDGRYTVSLPAGSALMLTR